MKDLDQGGLVQMMIGRALEAYFPGHLNAEPGEELLRVENLPVPGKFEGISFTLRAGEVLGFAGLVGAGRTEIAEALFGLDRLATGRVYVNGQPMPLRHPSVGMRHGLGMVPEDRKRHGLVLMMKRRENMSLPTLERLARWSWVEPGGGAAERADVFRPSPREGAEHRDGRRGIVGRQPAEGRARQMAGGGLPGVDRR